MEVYFLQRKWFLNILKCLISPQIPRNGEAKWRGERAGLTLGMTALMNTSYSPSYLWNRDDFTNDSISWPQQQCLQNNYGKYMTCLCLKSTILCHLSLYHPSGHISFFNLPDILRFGCTSHQSFFFQLFKAFCTSLPFIPSVSPAWKTLPGMEIFFSFFKPPLKCHFPHNIALKFPNGIFIPYLIFSSSLFIVLLNISFWPV